MNLVVDNGPRTRRVRLLLWASLLVASGATLLALHVFESYGLAPGDGGALRPATERIALSAFVTLFGASVLVGMIIYARAYVTALKLNGSKVIIETLAITGLGTRTKELPITNIASSEYYHGRFTARRPSAAAGSTLKTQIDAPWITLRIRDRTLPFVVDLQAKTIEHRLLERVAPKAVADWRRDRPHAFANHNRR